MLQLRAVQCNSGHDFKFGIYQKFKTLMLFQYVNGEEKTVYYNLEI